MNQFEKTTMRTIEQWKQDSITLGKIEAYLVKRRCDTSFAKKEESCGFTSFSNHQISSTSFVTPQLSAQQLIDSVEELK